MATVTAGAAYNKLEKTDNEISKGLQYWGGITAQQIEGDKNRAAKKAEDDANRKERGDERINKDIESKRFDFTSKDAGYASLTDNYSAFSRQAAEHHSQLWGEYVKARQSGDMKKAYGLEDQMQKIQTSFKEQQGAADKFKTLYDQYQQMDKDGKLSDYDKGKWKTIKGFMTGDTKNTYLQYDNASNTGKWISKELDPDCNEVINELSVSDIDNGRVAPILKNDVFGEKGMINNYGGLMGTYKAEYYAQNRDHSEEGYTKFAEEKLRSTIYNDLDEGEVKDLAAQFFNTNSGLEDPVKLTQTKNKVVDELHKRVMMMEKTKNSSKLNMDMLEYNQKERFHEDDLAAKPKPKDEIKESAGRLKFDANNAIKGDYAGLVGVVIESPDRKSTKVSTDVSERGNKIIVYFNDGSTEEHSKTEPDLINFMARDKHFKGKDTQKVVETAIKGDVIPYERESIGAGEKAKIAQGLSKLKESGISDDDKASEFISAYLPEGYTAENSSNWSISDKIDIKDKNGTVITTVEYTDKKSIAKAIDEINNHHNKNNSKSAPTDSQENLRSKYNY